MRYILLLMLLLVSALILTWLQHEPSVAPKIRATFSPSHLNWEKPAKSLPFAAAPSPSPPPRPANTSSPETLANEIRSALGKDDLVHHDLVFFDLLPALIKKSPTAAAALAGSLSQGTAREEMLRRIAQGWTDQNATMALRWARKLPNEAERSAAVTDVCLKMAETHAGEAVRTAMDFWPQNPPPELAGNLVRQWATQDMKSAIDWINHQPASSSRDNLLLNIAVPLAKADPEQAARIVAGEMSPGAIQAEAAIAVIHQWAAKDPTATTAWVQEFPAGTLRDRASAELRALQTISTTP